MALHRKISGDAPVELNPLSSYLAERNNAPRHALPLHELDPDVADLERHTHYFDQLTSPLPDAAGHPSFAH